MTLMDNIRELKNEESAKFAACMWIYTKEALTEGQILDREQEENLRIRVMSIMLCISWVCAGTFVDHEWVSSRTIIQQEEEIFLAWHWISKSMSRVLYSGAFFGSQRPRT